MDIPRYIITVLSDILLIIDSVLLIAAFGISKVKKYADYIIIVIFSLLCSTGMFWAYMYDLRFIPIIIYPLMFIVSFFIIFKKVSLAQLYIALVTELSVALISSSITMLLFNLISEPFYISNATSLFCVRMVVLVVTCIFTCKKKGTDFYIVSKYIPKYVFVLIVLTLIFVDFIAALNNYPESVGSKRYYIYFFIALLTITLIIMIFALLINVTSRNYYTALNSLLEKQVATQINHYEKFEKLNSDMRTFRHDYINHLSSINALIGEGCYTDAQKYIDKLTESTHRNEAIFLTGNRLADAILTDKSDNCKDFADIEFDGCITDKIENSDICIILANALDNAVEACKKCPERGKISIAAQIRQGYWTMAMRNPTVNADSEGIMKTSKEDEKNHGFGLLSIEQAVKKYDGTMAVSIKDGVFEMAVVLKIPVEN